MSKEDNEFVKIVIASCLIVLLFVFLTNVMGEEKKKEVVKIELPEESYYEVTQQQQEIIDETINNIQIIIEQYKHKKRNLSYEKTVSFEKKEEDGNVYFENEFLIINPKYIIKKNENKEDKVILTMRSYKYNVGNTCRALLKQMDEKGLSYGTYREVELNDEFTPMKNRYKKICDSFNENIAFNLN